MDYYTGAITARDDLTQQLIDAGVGLMMNPNIGYSNHTIGRWRCWAADNGCFNGFDEPRWLHYLETRPATAVFATVPDVVGDAAATRALWDEWHELVTLYGHRPAYVIQNGETGDTVPWEQAACIFIGGDTAYKLSPTAHRITQRARERRLHVHMGRVNSWRRLRIAWEWGCDSVDGTLLAYGPDVNVPRLLGWLTELRKPRQLTLQAR